MAATAGLESFDDVKKPAGPSSSMKGNAFERLPDEIIEQILQLTNPNSFASLIILNRKWREVSQQSHLYAHHLSRCPSYSAAHLSLPLPVNEDSLPQLRRLFAREIKRNLFEAYLRPRETIINIVSTSISSSSAPGGEAFHFSLSPRGHYVLAYSSSRLHVIDVTGWEVTVKREFKILRRPASATITDDGLLLAVLSTDLQVDLYDLSTRPPKHTRAVALDHTPRTIALSPTGSVLAAAYDSGVEVSSLNPSHVSTERRAVKCYAVDSLSFSRDGTQLLGTTMQSRSPSTVVLTAPYYDPGGSLPEDSISALWTTSILFPNGSRDCSHAVLLPSPDGEASWTFTYDRVFETFRAVRIDDLRNGTTYFTGPIADASSISKLLPSTLPTANASGDLVAAGFQSSIWLYGVPEDLEAVPNIGREGSNSTTETEVSTPSTSSLIGRRNSAPSPRSGSRQSISRIPQWQLLCDRLRNTFVEGRKIGTLDRVSALAWVDPQSTTFHGERLVGVAPGVAGPCATIEEDGMAPVDGGRIGLLDFDYSPNDGKRSLITIEVGMTEPEVLEEEHRDLDTEVALVRRRTVAQRRGNRNHVSRSATTVARSPRSELPPMMPTIQDLGDPFAPRALPIRRPSQQTTTSTDENASVDEDQEAFDAPYSHTSPRSGTTLRRAATAAAVNRRLHPRAVAQDHIEYRRADGREEHPHESDADNWVPPPPPYTREPIPPLPEHIQRSLLAEAAAATLQRSTTQRAPSLDFPGLDSGSLQRSRTIATISSSRSAESRRERYNVQRTLSQSTNMTADRISFEEEERPRPVTSPRSPNEFDDLYDVSPPGTPQLSPRRASAPVNLIPRRPVGAPASNSNRNVSPPTPGPTMRGTLDQPVSPIPQPNPMESALNRRLQDWEITTQPGRVSPILESAPSPTREVKQNIPPVPNPQVQSRPTSTLFKDVPPRPDELHHLTDLPPSQPVFQARQQSLESEVSPHPRRSETVPIERSPPKDMDLEPLAIWKRAETAPVAAPHPSRAAPPPPPPSMVMPSADQLARLNSRKGRPAGLADPRRVSGGSNQRPASGNHSRNASGGSMQSMNMQNTPPRLTPEQAFNTAPRAAVGSYSSSPQRLNPGYHQPPQQPYVSIPARRISNGASHNRNVSNSSPNLRPPMQRLETIHSQTSVGPAEPSPYFAQKAMMVSRQPSRAERSAAKNIKDAKKRGWRSSAKENKKKDRLGGDGASSTGWTDISRDSAMPRYAEKERKEKGGKCLVM
ncbi:uncharacterized protein LY89DRAFT_607535 [Mollisia scopiformis]|uniref:F-box domain-containing protein n=1 Tax=Mollisia scopiformis TaxID=149040 RepID=A0A194XRF6_MOLSC|nr:uncharacterized protein LY89DRAFT_607535 [Mollisia scopiformis]KUJ22731.1 hypothetical protein LY89DRAFT_607535 [Mollisia scopiformis]